MKIPSPRLMALVLAAILCAGLTAVITSNAGAGAACPAPGEPMRFDEQGYIDMTRAGGEPTIETHPSGILLYGSHAGTTHFYSPSAPDPTTAAFAENYNGQTYYYYSDDNGKTWNYVDRTLPPNNSPMQGFSDPEFAIDKAGQVYVSEINLANVAVSKSSDKGQTYTLQNFFGQTVSDRQWHEADEKDVLYLVGNELGGGTFPSDPVGNSGHYLHKSVDGGMNFTPGVLDAGGLGDIQVDKRDGALFEAHYNGTQLDMVAFYKIRKDDFTPTQSIVAKDVRMISHWPSLDIDAQGNIYITWDEGGTGGRPAGVYYSYSTDRGKTWAAPIRVDTNKNTDIWPWLAVGDQGKVVVAWIGADTELPDHNAETTGTHGWNIFMAQTLNGLGCSGSKVPGFKVVQATTEAIHTGTICQGGTACQAMAIDRRLGDYFTVEIDKNGHAWAGYSDTREGGGIALPGIVRQIEGPTLLGGGSGGGTPKPQRLGRPEVKIRFSDRTPARGDTLRVPAFLAACRKSPAAKKVLAGTKVTLKRVDGEKKVLGTKKVNKNCRTVFVTTADWDTAQLKAFWPKQSAKFRKGRSTTHEITTH